MSAPTNEEAYLLELINETRLDPLGNADRYIASYGNLSANQSNIQNAVDFFGVSGTALLNAYTALTPTGPLAWSTQLATAAHKHSAQMIAADQQSHQLPGEKSLGPRVEDEGYDFLALGENVYAYSFDALYAHAGFMIDWGYDDVDYTNGSLNSNFADTGDGVQDDAGHRVNIMNATYLEIGIDITSETNSSTEVGPQVVTQDLGTRGQYFVTGVAYTDSDNDDFYSPGEGRGDLTVTVGAKPTTSFASGVYSAQVQQGSNSFLLSGGGLAGSLTVSSTIGSTNLKIDIVDGDTLKTSGSISVTGPIEHIVGLGLSGLVLSAGSGSQTFTGTPGNDTYDGGAGQDVAVFAGNSSQYSASSSGSNVVISGPDSGSDTAMSIEIFRFADGDFVFNPSTGSLAPHSGGSTGENTAPVVAGSQIASTIGVASVAILIEASDPDGDEISYVAGSAGNGTIVGSVDGVFTYTPNGGFTGQDQFIVTVSDGKGGQGTQTVTVNVGEANAPAGPAFKLIATDDFSGSIGGIGSVFGTGAPQTVRLLDTPSNIDFGPSFNRGGNAIAFPDDASAYSIELFGSQVTIRNLDSQYVIPFGTDGVPLEFADGTLMLGLDQSRTQVQIGDQVVTHNASIIAATPEGPPSPGTTPLFSTANLQLSPGSQVGIEGNYTLFGTGAGNEAIDYLGGDLVLDPSFNRGGDELLVPGSASTWSAYIFGSSLVLSSELGNINVPIGANGMMIDFAGAGRVLRLDSVEGVIKLGDDVITSTDAASPQPLGSAEFDEQAAQASAGSNFISLG